MSAGGRTYDLERPYFVVATMNSHETGGTYVLPEAQVDRFMMKVLIGYPTEEEEFVIVERVTGTAQAVAAVATDHTAANSGSARREPTRWPNCAPGIWHSA